MKAPKQPSRRDSTDPVKPSKYPMNEDYNKLGRAKDATAKVYGAKKGQGRK